MLQDHLSTTHHSVQPPHQDADLLRLRSAGKQAAKSFVLLPPRRGACEELKQRVRRAARIIERQFKRKSPDIPDAQWLFENHRLILTAMKDATELPGSLSESRVVAPESAAPPEPAATAVARAYLRAALDLFSPEGLESFIGGFQEICPLEMGELWAIKPALELVIVERIAEELEGVCSALPALITSLRYVGEANWKDLFEAASITNAVLCGDPSGYFRQMDYESRDLYRNTIAILAKHSNGSEQQVAEKAVQLAAEASSVRSSHVGYWLLDRGLPALKSAIGYRASTRQRIRELVLAWPQSFYLIGIELLTLIVAFSILEERGTLTPTLLALALVLIPVTQAAVDFMNHLTTWLVRPRILPKLDFSDGIPAEFTTLVAVPTLLLNEKQVRQLVYDLEVRYLANRDPNLRFALVTDGPDSLTRTDQRDHLVDVCIGLIDDLNRRYAFQRREENNPGNSSTSGPFYLFHRHRIFNPSEGRWMGWERKRGKLLDLNHLMRGGYDSFPIKVGDLTVLQRIRYIITLDSDTQLPRDAARRLVGTIAHPLHRAVVDPATKMVVAGYGILQPRIAISIDSASSSRLANIYSGQTGFDIYTRAVSDVYQDLFGEGIFTGKGIYDIDALDESLDERFPENALLSHDLIEGAYARAGLVTDVELIDDYPSHFSAYSRRKHRWVRGDWQIMRWVLPRVPDYHGRIIANPLSLISRWKIIDNLRRSLLNQQLSRCSLQGGLCFQVNHGSGR